jgi:hypothetical protein
MVWVGLINPHSPLILAIPVAAAFSGFSMLAAVAWMMEIVLRRRRYFYSGGCLWRLMAVVVNGVVLWITAGQLLAQP